MSKEIKDRIDRILAQHDAAKEAAERGRSAQNPLFDPHANGSRRPQMSKY